MLDTTTFVGLDVHARSIKAVSLDVMTGEVRCATFGYDAGAVAEWVRSVDPRARCVYESGVTGFDLQKRLSGLGVDCVVGAVSKMIKPSADRRRKNDRNDAEFLARMLSVGNVVEVWVPDDECEAARDLTRALEDARDDLSRSKQRLSKFLLRHGLVFDERTPTGRRKGNWTRAHWSWIESMSEILTQVTWVSDRQERVGDAKRRLRDDHRVSLVGLGVAGEEPGGPVRRESRQVRRRHPGRPGAGEREGAYVARLVDDHERIGEAAEQRVQVVLPVRDGGAQQHLAISSRDACPVGRFPDIEPDDGFRHSNWCHGGILQSVGRSEPLPATPTLPGRGACARQFPISRPERRAPPVATPPPGPLRGRGRRPSGGARSAAPRGLPVS